MGLGDQAKATQLRFRAVHASLLTTPQGGKALRAEILSACLYQSTSTSFRHRTAAHVRDSSSRLVAGVAAAERRAGMRT